MFKNLGKNTVKSVTPLSVIARDMRIVGDIITQGEMQVDGVVDGDITCQTLVVGDGGRINGEITSKTVRVHGEVVGKINGEAVVIAKSARVVGDITHATLQIEAGAFLEGHLIRKVIPLALTNDSLPAPVAQHGADESSDAVPQPAE